MGHEYAIDVIVIAIVSILRRLADWYLRNFMSAPMAKYVVGNARKSRRKAKFKSSGVTKSRKISYLVMDEGNKINNVCVLLIFIYGGNMVTSIHICIYNAVIYYLLVKCKLA